MLYLLERLSVPQPRANGARGDALSPADAAVAQVQRIVATSRRLEDEVAQVPWGMPGATEIGAHDKVRLEAYADALGKAIARHEPRLASVKIEVVRTDDPLGPYRLQLTALFPGEEQPRNLCVPAPY